jgi:hypothetical protein
VRRYGLRTYDVALVLVYFVEVGLEQVLFITVLDFG